MEAFKDIKEYVDSLEQAERAHEHEPERLAGGLRTPAVLDKFGAEHARVQLAPRHTPCCVGFSSKRRAGEYGIGQFDFLLLLRIDPSGVLPSDRSQEPATSPVMNGRRIEHANGAFLFGSTKRVQGRI